MKKRVLVWILAGSMLVLAAACGKKELSEELSKEDVNQQIKEQEEKQPETILPAETEDAQVSKGETMETAKCPELFAELKYEEFVFASGAGAWGTILRIEPDGSFSGSYHDSDMGDNTDAYPNGTVYQCDFDGQFTAPVKVDDYTYSMQIAEMTYKQEVGTEEVAEGLRHIYSDAYGLQDTEDILLYLPGAPLGMLPEELLNWVGGYVSAEEKNLPFYAMYNEVPKCGFYSCNLIEQAREQVLWTEESAILIEQSLSNDPLTQSEMNSKSQEHYLLWDSTLNYLWQTLKKVLEEEAMQQLTVEEREWIAEKELAVVAAGSEVAGGSMQPLVENQKAAELTKERVYVLMELLEQQM